MSKPRLLITGGSGLLALNWACAMRDSWDVILGVHSRNVNLENTKSIPINLEDIDRLNYEVRMCSPDLIVHTAGLTNVDLCESRPDLSYISNEFITKNIASVSKLLNRKLVHISTDQLFNGEKSWYTENDTPSPINQYAKSKLASEQYLIGADQDVLILRTNFFGWGHSFRQSFSDWLIYNFRNGNKISLFEDLYYTPILADNVAYLAHKLIEKNANGIFNVVGSERISKYDFGNMICHLFELPIELIVKAKYTKSNHLANRPKDMSLSTKKMNDLLNIGTGEVDQFIQMLKVQEQCGRANEVCASVLR